MIWIVVVIATVVVALPLMVMWGVWQLEKLEIGDIDWRDDN
jgi:ABC-type molybdate transport system permease subunit